MVVFGMKERKNKLSRNSAHDHGQESLEPTRAFLTRKPTPTFLFHQPTYGSCSPLLHETILQELQTGKLTAHLQLITLCKYCANSFMWQAGG